MIGFWKRLVCGKRDKISCILYNLMYKMHTRNFYFSKWLDCVQNTLNNCGFSEYWIHQNVPDNCGLAKMIKKNALLISLNRPGIILYLNFLSVLISELLSIIMVLKKYLTLLPTDLRISFSKFRCTNHKLPIEKGRFLGIARDDRICNLCNSAKLGDEYHYIFECDYLKTERKKFIPQKYYKKTQHLKYHDLFNVSINQ